VACFCHAVWSLLGLSYSTVRSQVKIFYCIKRVGKVKTYQGLRLAVRNTSEYFSLFRAPPEDGADPASDAMWVVDVGDD
jgi:hypothetical protein